jgi:hypothetical protein
VIWPPLAAALVFAQAPALPPIGIAAGRGNQVCLAVESATLARGSTVTIVDPETPQSARRAVVRERLASCDAFDKSAVGGVYYRLQLPAGNNSTVTLAIGFAGAVASTTLTSGILTLRLSSGYPRVHVRSCTSSEGVHLTVWAGEPLKSRRLWHQYFHLDYDVEPSCEEGEVGEPHGNAAQVDAIRLRRHLVVDDFFDPSRQKSTR